VILFTQSVAADGIRRVSAAGGEVKQVTRLDPTRREIYHFWPQLLPDGRHFLYLAGSTRREDSALYVGSLDGGEPRLLMQSNSRAVYAPPGLLLYVREGTLLAHPFDAEALRLAGEPVTVAERVGNFSGTGNAYFSVSADGEVLAYEAAGTPARPGGSPTRLVWLTRGGAEAGSVGEPNDYRAPRLSPDGQKLAVNVIDPKDGTTDVWVYDLARSTFGRFTFDTGMENSPVWAPDGRHILYAHDSDGPPSLHRKPLGGAEGELLLPSGYGPQAPGDWSPDGRFVVYGDYSPQTRTDLLVLPMTGERKPSVFARTPFDEIQARFSPDGRWVAYASNESGRFEVYVRRFDGGGERVQVSNGGGEAPRWRRDGRELFYLTGSPDQSVASVAVKAGEAFESGAPVTLFKVELRDARDFDVSPDGQRFLVNTAAGVPPTPLTVVTGWAAGLKR
jgi:eukaryotic-like serine/threonine-protein kinase